MLYLTTLKGITRDGSLETIAEVAHPGAGGDASEVCNRYQDVISSTPEGDALRARYAQVLFILDNQVRSQLEFPPPSPSLEVTAESTGSGEGDLSGEGGAGDLGGDAPLTNHGDPVSTGESDPAGGDPVPDLLSIAADDEVSSAPAPGSLSPKGKAKGK